MPEGEYIFAIKDFKFGYTNNDKKTPKVDYEVIYQEALPSVDAEALAIRNHSDFSGVGVVANVIA